LAPPPPPTTRTSTVPGPKVVISNPGVDDDVKM
jgi:hypothetical protein